MGMVEEKLQELELSIGQYHLLSLVAQNPAIRVEPQAGVSRPAGTTGQAGRSTRPSAAR